MNSVPFYAFADIKGNNEYPDIMGTVVFKKKSNGVLITAEIFNLPYEVGICRNRFFGFHIHEGESCTGNTRDQFANAGMHFNPDKCPHPKHAGDLPPLLECNGYAYFSVLTNRFSINEIIGKTIIIHDKPDNFMTQPSGNAGNKIACGKILPL